MASLGCPCQRCWIGKNKGEVWVTKLPSDIFLSSTVLTENEMGGIMENPIEGFGYIRTREALETPHRGDSIKD